MTFAPDEHQHLRGAEPDASDRRRAGAYRSTETLDEPAEVGHVGGPGHGLVEAAH